MPLLIVVLPWCDVPRRLHELVWLWLWNWGWVRGPVFIAVFTVFDVYGVEGSAVVAHPVFHCWWLWRGRVVIVDNGIGVLESLVGHQVWVVFG